MNGNMSWIYYTEINILTCKIIWKPLKVFFFFREDGREVQKFPD